MTPEQLKASILQYAIQGKLVEQRPEEGTAEELYQQIQAEKQRLVKEGKIQKENPLPEIAEDEKPFDIPESWKWARLSSVIKLQSGQDMTPDKYNADHVGIPYITGASNITNGDVLINRWTECGKAFAYKGDILFTCKGTVGTMAVLQEPKVHIARQIMAIRSIGSISVYYIQVVLETLVSSLKAAAKSIIPGIAREDILTSLIPLPPLAEQHRIVAKIEELLPYIDRYAAAYEKLEQFNAKFPGDMKKSVLQYAIQGKLVEQRAEEGTGEELYRQIQSEKQRLIKEGKIKKEKPLPEIAEDEIPFDIPGNWKWVSVGNVCVNIQYGSSQKSTTTGKIAVLRMGNIQNGRLVLDKLVYTSDDGEIEKYPLQYNDLLFNRTNSKELVGKTAIYKGEIPAIYAGYLIRVTPLLIESDYLNYVMQSQFYWNYCQTVRSDAIGQSNINAEKLKQFAFPLPPLAEQKRIVAKLEEILPLCERLK